jgi:hypothetical protein
MLQAALTEYMDSRKGQVPTSIDDMLVDFQIPADHILLSTFTGEPEVDRYQILDIKAATTRPTDVTCPVFSYYDLDHDGCYYVTLDGTVRWNKF